MLNRFFKPATTKVVQRHWLNIPVEIHYKRMKNLRMRLNTEDGSLKISAPMQLPESEVFKFMQHHYQWIEKQRQNLVIHPKLQLNSGEKHLLWGIPYDLYVTHDRLRPSVKLTDNKTIEMDVPENYDTQQKIKLLDSLYRKQMKQVMPALLEKWQPIVGKEVNDWGIKKMRTRWGTCNIVAKRVWLSLELAKKPQACLEYVLVHELVHLHERHHNKRFYGLMTSFMPDWRVHEEQLKQGNQITEL